MIGMHVGATTAEPALWATQGGGLARVSTEDVYVWFELPDWIVGLPDGDPNKAAIGDPVHPEWDLIPANSLARNVMHEDEPFI